MEWVAFDINKSDDELSGEIKLLCPEISDEDVEKTLLGIREPIPRNVKINYVDIFA